jgi:L-seryl-tRNA(Ser) seleniumtransferase
MADPRHIPSIDRLTARPGLAALAARHGRRAVVDAVRASADAVRAAMGDGTEYPDVARSIEEDAAARLSAAFTPSLRTVINATGVVIHTNLGRAPLGEAAARRVAEVASGYANLEYDIEAGARGRRDVHAERLICDLTGAEAACVVNNNAAATLLTLAALASGREVIVSRGELVEIGGGFRVPDVMAQSGAVLREVGTTNRTRAADYAAAISERTALILRVHPSNFRIEGFTERPSLRELAALGREFNIPVVDDLGSGYLSESARPEGRAYTDRASSTDVGPTFRSGGSAADVGPTFRSGDSAAARALRDEPAVADAIRDGASVVMFSGDKLLGGPQAGIIAGERGALDRIRRHPLMRALRVDKMTYAALEATLLAWTAEDWAAVPVARMLHLSAADVAERAAPLAAALRIAGFEADVIDGLSTIGGGSAPGATLPTALVRLRHRSLSPDALERRLRTLDPPVVARIDADAVVLDLRTVLPNQDTRLLALLTPLAADHR